MEDYDTRLITAERTAALDLQYLLSTHDAMQLRLASQFHASSSAFRRRDAYFILYDVGSALCSNVSNAQSGSRRD